MKKLEKFEIFEMDKNEINYILGGTNTVVATGAGTTTSSACATGCIAYDKDEYRYTDGNYTGRTLFEYRDCDVEPGSQRNC